MHVRTGLRAGIVLAALAAGGACIIVDTPGGLSDWRGRFERLVPFEPGDALDLRSRDGDVVVRGWDRSEAEVRAEYDAERGARRGIRFLGADSGGPELDVERDEGVLRVRGPRADGDEGDSVLITVRLPESASLGPIVVDRGSLDVADVYGRLECEVAEGDLRVGNFSGSISASVGEGRAEVEALDARDGDEIEIRVDRGDILLRLEPGARFSLEAEAGAGGRASSEFDLGPAGPRLSGRAGEGGARITLRTGDGDVRVVRGDGRAERGGAAR